MTARRKTTTPALSVGGSWVPVAWEPVIHPGADFVWATTVQGDHAVVAGEVWLGGETFDLRVGAHQLSVRAPADRLTSLVTGDPAEIIIELATGDRLMWLAGALVVRSNQ